MGDLTKGEMNLTVFPGQSLHVASSIALWQKRTLLACSPSAHYPPRKGVLSCSSLFSFGQHRVDTFLNQNAHISCFPWSWSSSLLSDSYQGQLGILNWITLTRKKAWGVLFQHHLASEMPVSTLLPSESTSLFLLSIESSACLHPANTDLGL